MYDYDVLCHSKFEICVIKEFDHVLKFEINVKAIKFGDTQGYLGKISRELR